jgi:hypothetical protein
MSVPVAATPEERRAELAALAARTRRANEPRSLVVLAGVGVLVSAVVLGLSVLSYVGAALEARAERERAGAIATRVAHLRALGERASTDAADAGESITRFRSRIDRAGVEAGLRDPLRVPAEAIPDIDRTKGTRQVQLTFDIRDPSMEALVQFMQRAVAEVPGLEVQSIQIKPEAQVWYLQVKFARWERLEGTP